MVDLHTLSTLPWLVGGDLNEIFYHKEKKERIRNPRRLSITSEKPFWTQALLTWVSRDMNLHGATTKLMGSWWRRDSTVSVLTRNGLYVSQKQLLPMLISTCQTTYQFCYNALLMPRAVGPDTVVSCSKTCGSQTPHVEMWSFLHGSPLQRLTWSRMSYTNSTPTPPNSLSGIKACLLYTSPSPRDGLLSRMPSSA